MALVGGLLRRDWSHDEIGCFIRAVTAAAGDEEATMRLNTIKGTAEKLRKGLKTTGLPKLAELVGSGVVERMFHFLNLDGSVSNNLTNGNEEGQSAELLSAELGYTDITFPIDALPRVMKQYILEASESVSSCLDYVGVPLIAAAGAAIGRTRKLARIFRELHEELTKEKPLGFV